MPGRSEGDALGRVLGIGTLGVERRHEARDVHEQIPRGGLAGERMDGHGALRAIMPPDAAVVDERRAGPRLARGPAALDVDEFCRQTCRKSTMPKIVDVAEQREHIRRAARRVFARRDPGSTGLAHVAAAAGIGRATLYHYYPDRAGLLRDLARELLAEEERLFESALRGTGSPLRRIEALAGGLTDAFEQWASVGRMLLDLWFRDAKRSRAFFRRLRRRLAQLIAEGQACGEIDRGLDADVSAGMVIALIDGMLLQHWVDPAAFTGHGALHAALADGVRRMLGR
jgi:AcrR family transcriptional regulator